MSVSSTLLAATGVYHGTGDGAESGPFMARIAVSPLPNGGVSVDYEATSREQGVQHLEHSLLTRCPDGADQLVVAHSESPYLTIMQERVIASGRFEQVERTGPYVMSVVIEVSLDGELTYAWWWATAGEVPVEQSKASVRRSGS